jgi:hypothetical protein
MRDGLLFRTLYGCAPLLLWAVHFFAMYLLAAMHASDGLLLAVTLAAIVGNVWMLWQAWRVHVQGHASFHHWAMAVNAVLAAVAIAWTTLSFAMLRVIGGGD